MCVCVYVSACVCVCVYVSACVCVCVDVCAFGPLVKQILSLAVQGEVKETRERVQQMSRYS